MLCGHHKDTSVNGSDSLWIGDLCRVMHFLNPLFSLLSERPYSLTRIRALLSPLPLLDDDSQTTVSYAILLIVFIYLQKQLHEILNYSDHDVKIWKTQNNSIITVAAQKGPSLSVVGDTYRIIIGSEQTNGAYALV